MRAICLAGVIAASCVVGCEEAADYPAAANTRPLVPKFKLSAVPDPSTSLPKDPILGMGFGDVAVSGDTLTVGAINLKEGATFVYQRTSTASGATWTQTQVLFASTSTFHFGRSILEGNTMIVDDRKSSSAYYFERAGSQWTEKQVLYPPQTVVRTAFGRGKALQGKTLVIGAPGVSTTVTFGPKPGLAHVFVKCGTRWHAKQRLACPPAICKDESSFGSAVSLSGDTLLVGAMRESTTASLAGVAFIYLRSGTTWNLEQQLTPKDLQAYDYFGSHVSLDGDTAVVGADGHDIRGKDSGAVYIFDRSGTTWTQSVKLTSSDQKARYFFGGNVLLKNNILFVGAPGDDAMGKEAGSVYVYHRSGTTWTKQFKLLPPKDKTTEWFGYSLSFDGKTLAVGADEMAFVGTVSTKTNDSGPPDLGPDTSLAGPDPCADMSPDQSPDRSPPDQKASPDLDAGQDLAVIDAATPDSAAPGGEQDAGCSCTVKGRPQPGAPPLAHLLLLLLLIPCLLRWG